MNQARLARQRAGKSTRSTARGRSSHQQAAYKRSQHQKEGNHLIIHRKRWYRYYYNDDDRQAGLLSEYQEETIKQGLLVQCTPNGDHLYSYFPNILSFLQYEAHFSLENRGFFETVLATVKQKPRFDLDVKVSENKAIFDSIPDKSVDHIMEDLITYLVWGIIQVLADVNVKLDLSTDILMFTSHGEDKRSFHIVIDNYCHEDFEEAKHFYKLVMRKLSEAQMPAIFIPWIDHSVYSKLQQFRMEGSQKYKSGRIKQLKPEWTYGSVDPVTIVTDLSKHLASIKSLKKEDQEILHFPQAQERYAGFSASLLTNTGYCETLPSFIPLSDRMETPMGCLTIHDDMAKQAIELLAEKMGTQVGASDFPFALKKISSGGIIVLKRLFSSHCQICDREHEAENPFMYIIKDMVFFNCRRNMENRSIKVGEFVNIEEEIAKGPTDEELRSMDFVIPTVGKDGKSISSSDKSTKKEYEPDRSPEISTCLAELKRIAIGDIDLGRSRKGKLIDPMSKHKHIRAENDIDISIFKTESWSVS
jgi:hypothetical protein